MRLPRPRHRLLELTALAVGCAGPLGPPHGNPDPVVHEPPAITSLTLACDPDAEAWSLDVATDAWSGGGQLVWTVDDAYVETHRFYSVAAEADGSADALSLRLAIASDWRDVTFGTSTAFPCAADPSAVIVVDDLEGAQSDCRVLGPDPDALLALDGVPACVTAAR